MALVKAGGNEEPEMVDPPSEPHSIGDTLRAEVDRTLHRSEHSKFPVSFVIINDYRVLHR